MIPFSGIIHPERRRLHQRIVALADGYGHSYPGAAIFRILQKNGAAMDRRCTAYKHHTKTDSVAAVFDLRLPLLAGENAAS